MAGPLLYKPMPTWQLMAAFGGALAVHLAAVGIAALKPDEPPPAPFILNEQITEISFEPEPAPPEPPTPEEEPEPLEAPPEPTDPPEFVEEEKPTPPPRPRTDKPKPVAPIARPTGPVGPPGPPNAPAPSGRAAMVSKGNVQYPYEAKRSRLTGSGVARVSVTPGGTVSSVSMAKSTGHPVLDNAAISGLRGARFKPGTVPTVNIPITFTLTGAQF